MSKDASYWVKELESFQSIWGGGYFEGDCLHPMARSGYGQLGFISTLHATYLRCIKPYINEETTSLEIGPGRGAWTKAILSSKEVYALDALPEEKNRFYKYLEYPTNVKYFQIHDFRCDMLPDYHFNYMFSYGCLCHVSFQGITDYAVNIYPKLKRGSNCFWMIADYEKYNRAIHNWDDHSLWAVMMPRSRRYLLLRSIVMHYMKRTKPQIREMDINDDPVPGRWYHAGVDRTCCMLREVGYSIVDSDVGTCLTLQRIFTI